MDKETQGKVADSIIRQWQGGEHRLAGERASEFVYGKSKAADEAKLKLLTDREPGLSRYISAPAQPIETVDDQGGNPQATQPENAQQQAPKSNLSDETAKDEQTAIDDALKAGREKGGGDTEASKLNPAKSDADKPAKSAKA